MDASNKLIKDIIAEQDFLVSECNGVSVADLYDATAGFQTAFAAWSGEEVQREAAAHLAESLLDVDRAELVFQLITHTADGDPDRLSLEDKAFALRMAETMGPDWCQWLYHFSVLCTKLA